MTAGKDAPAKAHAGFLGSLRDALAAASRDDTAPMAKMSAEVPPAAQPEAARPALPTERTPTPAAKVEIPLPPAADAVREARAGAPNIPPLVRAEVALVPEDAAPTTRVHRATPAKKIDAEPERTRIVRGKPKVAHGDFEQDPVVGWLVVIGGPGLGAFRPIFEGNNTIGRGGGQRVAIDFGDDTISSEEQAYIRYDSAERGFLFVPNLAKTNIVSLNGKRPTAAVPLSPMDVIGMGRTQLVFVPFCGPDFDWSELSDKTA